METKSCAILLCNPMCFPWGYDEEDERCGALKLILMNTINFWRNDGIRSYVVPLDSGVGLYAAEILGQLREEDPSLSLTCLVPWEQQVTKWAPDLWERYFNVQARCSDVETISAERTASCELEAKLRAIDLTERVFAITAKEQEPLLEAALHYARRTGKTVLVFDSDRIAFHE